MLFERSTHLCNLLLLSILFSGNIYAQQFSGTYSGNFSGDLNGTFQFTVNNNNESYINLEGKFKTSSGAEKIIVGGVKPGGLITAAFFDKRADISYGITRGIFKGTVKADKASGTW